MKNSLFVEIIKRIIKKAKIRTLLMIIALISFNSVAWFIYATKVENGISARIVAWNVSFLVGEDELLQDVNFRIDRIYPGMDDYYRRIDVTNTGDTSATLSYEIVSARLLDETYVVGDGLTSQQLLNSLESDYPFRIETGRSEDILPTGSSAYLYVSVTWPFESGNDALDTIWGNRAYDFQSTNPGEESIELNLRITASQKRN